ncbi:unnamed protein product [Boreogadus saida]
MMKRKVLRLQIVTVTAAHVSAVVVLYLQGVGSKEWREFGRTEVIDNTLNPDFVRKFVLDFFFEEKQNLRFDVYNVDTRSCNISKHVRLHCTAVLPFL